MLSNKDIRIEDGNLIINGDKHPIVQDVSGLYERTTALEGELGLIRGEDAVLVVDDDAVKQLITDAENGSVKICIVNPSTSAGSTPFAGHAYVLISARLRDDLAMQYAISIIETANKKRLYTGTWSAWA